MSTRRWFWIPLFSCFIGTLAAQQVLRLEEMTWPEIEQALQSGIDTAVVIIGATEQHGPQIALSSDTITGHCLVDGIAERIGTLFLAPPIPVGISSHHMNFAGTITARQEVLQPLLREYVHSLAWHGFRHIIILPTHGGNFTLVKEAGEELSRLYPHVNIIPFSDGDSYIETMKNTSRRLGIDLETAGSHAGLSETAMILACRPERVRMDQARPGFLGDAYGVGERASREGTDAVTTNGVFGDPRTATAEMGRAYLDDLSALLATFIENRKRNVSRSGKSPLPGAGLKPPQGPLARGIELRRAGNFEAAAAFFEANRKTEDSQAVIELARTRILSNDFKAAGELLAPLLQASSPDLVEQAHDELALLALYQGQFQKAIEHKQQGRRLRSAAEDPRGEAHKLLYIAYVQTETGQLEQASQTFRQALQLAPERNDLNLDLQHLEGLLLVRQGRLLQADQRLRSLEDAVLTPEFSAHLRRYYHLKGELLLARGRIDDALLNLPRAIEIYDHPLYRESMGRALWKAGRLEEAGRRLQHLIGLTDARLDIPIHYVKAHFQLAQLFEEQGKRSEAIAMYQKFLSYWDSADFQGPEIEIARDRLQDLAR